MSVASDTTAPISALGPNPPRRLRLAALYSNVAAYTAPLFRELSNRPGVDLTVYYLSQAGSDVTFHPLFGRSFKWDVPLLEGYEYRFLPNLRRNAGVTGFFSLMNFSVIQEIRKKRYDALLVHGYEHFAKWLAVMAAKSCGTPLIFRGESHLNEPRSPIRRVAKQVILGNLFKAFDGFACIGSLNRGYYEAYGVGPERLHLAPYSVDNRFFSEAAGKLRSARPELRRALGIADDAPVILCVGKLIGVKQPELLLRAFSEVRKLHACHLLLVGDGALRQRIEAEVRASSIPDVHLTGFLNQTRIPEMHVCADIFVLPSRHEPWGLAVNEAMATGLPIVTTDRVGCSPDLVHDGVNGFVVRHDDPGQLAGRLATLVADPVLRSQFGNGSREIIAGWSLEKTADGIVNAALLNQPCDRSVAA